MRLWLALGAVLLALPAAAQDEAPLKRERHWVRISSEAIPKTVLVEVRAGGRTAAVGSGAIVTADGHIVTCAHVVEALQRVPADYACVTSDGKRHPAKLLGRNSANDIALLKIEAADLAHFEVSKERRPKANAQVLAIGYPMGNLGTGGIRKGRKRDAIVHPSVMIGRVIEPSAALVIPAQGGTKFYPDAVVTDTPVFMGNSGGPMVNEQGQLIGLNAAIMPAANKTFTLSSESIARVYETLKKGNDAPGVRPGTGEALQRAGRTILEALGANFRKREPDRAWLREPFREITLSRRSGVIELRRGDRSVGLATLIDEEGHAVTALPALESRTWGEMLVREIDKVARNSDLFRDLWGKMKEMLERQPKDELVGILSTGQRVKVKILKESKSLAVALLKVTLPENVKIKPIPQSPYTTLKPGHWALIVGTGELPIGVGLISHGHHSARGIITLPTSFGDLWENLTRGGNRQVTFKDSILHDVRLTPADLGAPLLDSRGRLIGINLYHPARGTSYAARLDNILREFKLGDGI
jgi:S1-C subfamily serine protease